MIGHVSSSLHSFQSAHIIPLHSEENRYTNIPSGEIWFCSTKKILYIITRNPHYFTYSQVPRDQKKSLVGRWTQNVGGKTLGSLAILKQQSYIAMLPLTGTTRITTIFRIRDPNLNLHLPTVTKWGVRIPTHTKRIAQHPKWKQICRQCSLRHRRQDRQSGGREGPLCWVPYFQRSSWNCEFFLPETSWNPFLSYCVLKSFKSKEISNFPTNLRRFSGTYGVPTIAAGPGHFWHLCSEATNIEAAKNHPTNTRAEVFSNESWKRLKFRSTKS